MIVLLENCSDRNFLSGVSFGTVANSIICLPEIHAYVYLIFNNTSAHKSNQNLARNFS